MGGNRTFYNSYIMYKISGKKNLFWASLVCGIGTAISYAVMLIEAYEPDPYYYGGLGIEVDSFIHIVMEIRT